MNSHRRHRSSVTHARKIETHLAEIAQMHALVADRVAIDPSQREMQAAHYDLCRRHLMGLG